MAALCHGGPVRNYSINVVVNLGVNLVSCNSYEQCELKHGTKYFRQLIDPNVPADLPSDTSTLQHTSDVSGPAFSFRFGSR
jgi:hypothetical protein